MGDFTIHNYRLDLSPVAKPRMVRSDKWKSRAITNHYWAFKDELKLKANLTGLKELPSEIENIHFTIPMPESWSKKKKEEMNGKPHLQTPDLDNLIKALQDCLCSQDKHIWKIGLIQKVWGEEGEIFIQIVTKDDSTNTQPF